MDGKRLYCAGGTAAARYAGEYLRNFYVDLAERPGADVGAVLLDIGTAEPVRLEKNEVALVRLRVEF